MVRKRALETSNASSNSTDTDVPEDTGETISEADTIKTETNSFNVEEEFKKLYDKAVELGLTGEDFAKMEVLKDIGWSGSYVRVTLKYICIVILSVLLLFYVTFMIYLVEWPIGREKILDTWFWWNGENPAEEMCAINMPEFVNDIFRPPVDCDFCENLTAVETVYNISSEEFEDFFGYTGIPVVIGDGTVNWTATEFFSFEFFKEIYKEGSAALDNQMTNCQFFPYKTSFRDLGEVLSMSPERARMEDGSQPWYIGWSNCDFSAANILRKHYQRPYFLPKLSESSKTDWMFMGSPGYGAHMHIDNVGHPSWQAQVTGTKRWTLEPPPECYYTCADSIEVTVNPGQIIVLDTNIWYHSTLNVGQDISITIGSEYD